MASRPVAGKLDPSGQAALSAAIDQGAFLPPPGSPGSFRRGSALPRGAGEEPFQHRWGSETVAPAQDEVKGKGDEYQEIAMANAERELAEDAEWKRIQENTFTRWVNEHLRQAGSSINDLETDFSNGLKLIALLEVLSGKRMPRHNKKPTFRSQKLENVSIALKFLESEGVHLVNIDSTDITDCKLKLIMGLIWTLILHYSISMPMYDGPELGGPVDDKTPKQRLLGWMQNKVPGLPIANFTSDWHDGIKVGALVDSVAPGLCPDWEDWDPNEPVRNATEAMDLADNWLGVPKLLTPEEIVNPNVDEMSMMTYLSQFPNAKVKENAPLRAKAVASKVRAFGPGLESTGCVAKAPAKFTVETFGAGDGDLNIAVKGPDGTDYKVDKSYNNDRKKSWACSYFPDKEGDFVVPITWSGRNVPNSPFNVNVEGFAGDANKVTVAGPGIEPEGVVVSKPTEFDIFTAGAGKGKPEVIVLDPHGMKEGIPVKIIPSGRGDDSYTCEYAPQQLGVHSVNVFFAGNPIPDSPFGVKVGPASDPARVHASGRGLQPHGLRAHETVDFKVFTEGAGEGTANVKIIGPGGAITPTTRRNIDPHTIEYKYTPERDGRYRVMITWAGKEIPRSPFEVNIAPHKSTKIKAFGPGLKGGVVDMPALFCVDTCGETGALGFSIEGPSQAKINCKDNGDGSADVDYTPTVAGEYAVHILCDNEDIPGSPYMAQILPKTDYDPDKVKCYGPGLEGTVLPNVETNFTVDTTKAGNAPLDVLFMDDYGEMKPLWKDENGIHDPKDGGIMAVKLIKAKELIKADLIGKSDPYAVIKHGSQKFTTNVIKNCQTPEWNYEAQLTIPDQGDKKVTIEIFDSDRIGKDKSLGSISFDASEIVKQKVIEQGWYPLTGAKSGQVLMSADFLPASPSMARDILRPGLPTDGHKNLDVNRPLLEKKSEGIYECTYTPRKTQKQVIWINYGGVAVPGSPFRVTVDDPTDPSKVKVYGKGVEDGNKADQHVTFTIDCQEAGPGDLAVKITDDRRMEVPIDLKDKGDHTFSVGYRPKKNGTHSICIKYDGREIPQSPIKVNVKTDIDMKKIKVNGLDDEVFVDCTNDFDVDTSALPADVTPNIACSIKNPDGTKLPNFKVDKPTPDGNVMVSYTPTQEGKHDIDVTCDGTPVHGSPFKVNAKKGCNPTKVKAHGPGLEKGFCHEPNQFTIETRNAGTGGLGLAIEGPAEAKMTCKDNRDGSCTVDYVPTEEGNYDISVKFEEQDIPGSPFKVPVVDLSPNKKTSVGKNNPVPGTNVLPEGSLHINVIKAKELIKSDIVGKSDPYAVVKYGKQKFKTPTVKNSQEPKWEYELDLQVPEGDLTEVSIEVFDADKFGKDKSLGKTNIDIAELAALDNAEGKWYTLTGVKTGKILLACDFLELIGEIEDQSQLSKANNRGDSIGQPDKLKSNLPSSGKLPEGKVCVNLVKAKELVKTDMVGKSDPYAVLKYASQKYKTPTKKNTQEPVWDYHANFDVPEGETRNVVIEVFDADKFGKDKSLGKVDLDLAELVNLEDEQGCWYPLTGVKSGKVLLSADFLELGNYEAPEAIGSLKGLDSSDPKAESIDDNKSVVDNFDDLPDGKLQVNIIRAKELIKTDLVGKSDPYALLKYGNQKFKTKTVKNSLEPLWNHQVVFEFPEGKTDTVLIEVWDADRFGKDKSLGKLNMKVLDLINIEGKEGRWFPLSGVKSGQVLLSADLVDDQGNSLLPAGLSETKGAGIPSGAGTLGGGNDGENDGRRGSKSLKRDNDGRKESGILDGDMDGRRGSGPLGGDMDGRRGSGPLGGDMDGRRGSGPLGGDMDGRRGSGPLGGDVDGQKGSDTSGGDMEGRRGSGPWGKDDVGRKGSGLLADDNDDQMGPGNSLGGGKMPYIEELPTGQAKIKLIKAKDLIKSDILGKSDPYAILSYGKQREETKVIKNSQDPIWNHEANFDVPDGENRLFNIEVFDSDKIGKDKSLGKLNLDITEVLDSTTDTGKWFPLTGVKSGEVLLAADFLDELGRNPSDILKGILESDPSGRAGEDISPGSDNIHGRKSSLDPKGILSDQNKNKKKRKTFNLDDATPEGTAVITVVKAKDLVKSDMIGKSDPYAVLVYGKQARKTSVCKNTQNPEWNYEADFNIPEGDEKTINIEVFDKDKIGKDKSLGNLKLDLAEVLSMDGDQGQWFSLSGVASGEILLMSDFIDRFGNDTSGQPSALLNESHPKDPTGQDWRDLIDPTGEIRNSAPDHPQKNRKSSQDPTEAKRRDSEDPEGSLRKNSFDPKGSDKKYPHDQTEDERRGSQDPRFGNKNDRPNFEGEIPEGTAIITVVKAKDLIKSDIIGKSDPYAVLSYGKQEKKSGVAKNTQNPEWNFEADFKIPEGKEKNINIEVFDKDKIGKDKSLGKLQLNLDDVLAMDGDEGHWYPLSGVKSGQILLMSDFIDQFGKDVRGHPSALLSKHNPEDSIGNDWRDIIDPTGDLRKQSQDDHDVEGKDPTGRRKSNRGDIENPEGPFRRGSQDPQGIEGRSSHDPLDVARKGSKDLYYGNKDGKPLIHDEDIPEGTAIITVVKARDLIKSDIIGKSDPYAVLVYGKQHKKSPVVKNTQNPVWNYEADFKIPDGNDETMIVEVFDKDRIGKDKSLGTLELNLKKVIAMDGDEGHWFPLSGVKSGEILLMSDFIDQFGKDTRGLPSALLNKSNPEDPTGSKWRDLIDPTGDLRKKSQDATDPQNRRHSKRGDIEDPDGGDGILSKDPSVAARKGSQDPSYGNKKGRPTRLDDEIPEGTAVITVVKAKDLIKSDIIGKSDPYAVLVYGKQKKETPVSKNTQNPEWNYEADFKIPEGDINTINIEVFDKDKIGKDKSLGIIDLNLNEVLNMDGDEGRWFPLSGVKSGEILLMTDFIDQFGNDLAGKPSSLLSRVEPGAGTGPDWRDIIDPSGELRKESEDPVEVNKEDNQDLRSAKRSDSTNPDAKRRLSKDPRKTSKNDSPDSALGNKSDLPSLIGGEIPEGTAVITVVKAKDLVNADIIGKSDPYAVLVYGTQQKKTHAVNNTLNPEWNYEVDFQIPEGNDKTIYVEVFDKDKIGKDKSLGNLNLNLDEVMAMDGNEGCWFPLSGVKSGQILLMSDFIDPFGNDSRGQPSALLNKSNPEDPMGNNWRDIIDPVGDLRKKSQGATDDDQRNPEGRRQTKQGDIEDQQGPLRRGSKDLKGADGRKGSQDPFYGNTKDMPSSLDGKIPDGTAIITVVKAKDLIKSDVIGKSDPYAVLKYGKQQKKTPVAKNTQNPEWKYEADFKIPDGDDKTILIEVFDKDKIGKDTSLGNLYLNLEDALAMDGDEGQWFTLSGVKSGEILLMSDFIDQFGKDTRGQPSALLSQSNPDESTGKDWRDIIDPTGDLRRLSEDPAGGERKLSQDPSSTRRKDSQNPDLSSPTGSKDQAEADRRYSSDPLRKGSQDPTFGKQHGVPSPLAGDIPEGTAVITIVRAKELIKSDIIGKSDPYAVIDYGKQKKKTHVAKNTQNPEWNFEADFKIPEGDETNIFVEVFDKDRIGKDKSLGSLKLDMADVLAMDGDEGHWFPLSGVKSGQILLTSDFIDPFGRDLRGQPSSALLDKNSSNDPTGKDWRDLIDPTGDLRQELTDPNEKSAIKSQDPMDAKRRDSQEPHPSSRKSSTDHTDNNRRYSKDQTGGSRKGSQDAGHLNKQGLPSRRDGEIPEGTAVITVVKAKDLIKSDIIGKSDPYAVLEYGKQAKKTPVAKNTQNPEWNYEADFKIPDGDDNTIYIEVFDKDKIGKDKSLGTLSLILDEVLAMDGDEGQWLTLSGVKSGQILLMSDFIDQFGENTRGDPSALLCKTNTEDPAGEDWRDIIDPTGSLRKDLDDLAGPTRKDSQDPTGVLRSRSGSEVPEGPPRKASHDSKSSNKAKDDKSDSVRKSSKTPSGASKEDPQSSNEGVPVGKARFSLIKAKDLIKADMIGKSDPYAVMKFGKQINKTKVVKNNQNPEWNEEFDFDIPDGENRIFQLDVFDSDRFGKDKSLGRLDFDITEVQDMDGQEGQWYPLKGVKSGQVLLSADILQQIDKDGNNRKDVKDFVKSAPVGGVMGQGSPDGKARVNLIQAKDLIKADLVGKSDPYAILKYGTQKYKTPTVKNSQNPEWDCEVEFDVPEGDDTAINIEVFDEDLVGKDKSLGKLDLDLTDLDNLHPDNGQWFPLEGVKSGQVLLAGDIMGILPEDLDRGRGQSLSGNLNRKGSNVEDNVKDGEGVPLSGSGSRKGSNVLSEFDNQLPEGQVSINLVKAKDLEKKDMLGKSDPYAVLTYGGQKEITPTLKNTQNPQWDHEANFDVPDDNNDNVHIEIFDSDKIGKDKPLGHLDLDIYDIINGDGDSKWYPLEGAKSGQILLNSDFLQPGSGGINIPGKSDVNKTGKEKPGVTSGEIPDGKVHIDLVKAKNLKNTDRKGKSDPYAVLKYGNQKLKTNTIRNTQNPEWDFGADFEVPDGKASDIVIEVFDDDKLGRDKSLGQLNLDIEEILNNDSDKGKWYPLNGVNSGELLISSAFCPPGADSPITSGLTEPNKTIGGKGSGSADPSKVKAFGPGLDPENVLPGKPASFSVDSSKTGPAPLVVEVEGTDGGKVSSRKPSIEQVGPGLHDVTYVPPPVGQPYEIGVKYGGEDVPGSPFSMSPSPDLEGITGSGPVSGKPEKPDRKGSKIGISVNPDSENLGKIHVGLIAAKDLIKADIMGKSDPYAILSHGNQKFRTNTVKNSQEPEWNYDADFNVPDAGDNTIKVDIYDADKLGRDKPLGSTIFSVDDVMDKGMVPPAWYPLQGAKSGQVLMSADFEALDSSRLTSPERGLQETEHHRGSSAPRFGKGGKGLKNRMGTKGNFGGDGDYNDFPEGTLHVDLLAARNLAKGDMIGKSDPYAVLKLGDESFRTDTIKNTQNPEWNFGADFLIDDSTPSEINLSVFDQDKFGKDKSLGIAALSVEDLIENPDVPNSGTWVPLQGTKSGEVLVSTNFQPEDEADYIRRMSGHGIGKKNIDTPKGLAALKNKAGSDSVLGDNLNEIPEGNVHVNLIQAKNLMKSDIVGKSDPYAVISCGDDKSKTKTVNNDQNPEFNHDAFFPVENNGPREVKVDVFDADKHGADKPLGSATIDISELANEGPLEDVWIPLNDGKGGEVNISADFQPRFHEEGLYGGGETGLPGTTDSRGGKGVKDPNDPINSKGINDPMSARGGKGTKDRLKGKPEDSVLEDLEPGNLHLALHQAKNLQKNDLIGKSDPYAVISFDDQKLNTNTVKNNQNPEWNFNVDIPVDSDGPRHVSIDVFDKDKFGKDKSLGSTQLDVADIQAGNILDGDWLALDGAKSGELQVSSNFSPDDETFMPVRPTPGLGDLGSARDQERRNIRKDSDMSVDGLGPNERKQSSVNVDSEIPAGNIHLNIHEAKDLIKADLIGKSDPYAVVTYDDNQAKTKPIKNNLNPKWNFETDIPTDDGGPTNMKIEIFDNDKLGKDKSLGSVDIDVSNLVNKQPLDGEWMPLNGVKSGQLKVSADFNPDDGYDTNQRPSKLDEKRGSLKNSSDHSRRGSGDVGGGRNNQEDKPSGKLKDRKGSGDVSGGDFGREPDTHKSTNPLVETGINDMPGPGVVNVNVIQGKDLIKTDIIGKSDPYAVLTYGDAKVKSNAVKNSQNPEWNFEAEIPVDENSPDTFKIEVFDKDKFGKDKSLGSSEFDIPGIAHEEPLNGAWIPLDGVKSGQIQVSADYNPLDTSEEGDRRPSGGGGAKSVKENLGERQGKKISAGGGGDYNPQDIGEEDGRKPSSGGGAKSLKDGLGDGRGKPNSPDKEKGPHSLQRTPTDQNIGSGIPSGNIHLEIQEGKDLIKADLIGKADPYAVVTYGDEKVKSKPVKNSQNPKWNFVTDIPTNPDGPQDVKIEVFDKDKFGKDKPLGSTDIDIPSLLKAGPLKDAWIPLAGVKSGQIKLSADFNPDDSGFYDNKANPQDDQLHGSKPFKRTGSGLGDDSQTDDNLPSERHGSAAGSGTTDGSRSFPRTGSSLGRDSDRQSTSPRPGSGTGSGPNNPSEGPVGNVHLEIIGAKDLVKKDMIGKSDPYAVVTYGDDKIKTNTVKNNQNPQWNFEADIPIDPNGPSNVTVEVFDSDKLGKDKPLGSANIDIPSLMNNATLKEAWIPLSGVKSGQLQLSADFVPIDEDPDSGLYENVRPNSGSQDGGRKSQNKHVGSPGYNDDVGSKPNTRKPSDNTQVPGNIHLNIVQAKDLIKSDVIGKSDPYAVVTYGNEKVKTITVKNSQNPEWNFEADIPYNPNYSDTLKIEIFDEDKLGKDKLIGTSYLNIPNITNNDPLDSVWIPLSGVKSGQVQLSADFTPDPLSENENVKPEGLGGDGPEAPTRDSGALGDPRSPKDNDKLGSIKLNLLMAKDLINNDMVGKSDPYAIITHGDQKFKTDIKRNTQNPEWNIQCELEVPDTRDRNISIDLYDADKLGKDTFLGGLNLDIARVMNLGKLEESWYPLDGVDQGQVCVGADFVPDLDDMTSSIVINEKFMETRRSSSQFHEVSLNRIPLPSTGGLIEASIRTPSGRVDKPEVQDDNNGTVAVKYQPTEEGVHYLEVKYNGDQVQGSPFKFHVNRQNNGKASAYGPGLTHGVCGESANFTVSTKGAGAGGLNLAVEGPSKAEISCQDNKDGTVNVSYMPTAPGEYKITAKFAEEHIPGSPFTCKITGEGKKRNQISVGSSSELQLPGDLSESDLRSLKAYIESPSGGVEQCFLKKLPRGNIGISFTPREVGEHLVSVKRNEKHITNSPFKIMVNSQEVGDASRVLVEGEGIRQGKTHSANEFQINTKSAGYGGLSLSIEGPSKAEIDCKDNEDGTLDVDYTPTEPGFYIINIKFADSHVPGSPFQVPISGEGADKQTENLKRHREAVPVTEVGSQCRLTFKMPGISLKDLEAKVTSPSGRSTKANVTELEDGLYAVNFVPQELGIHTVTVRYREMDIPGSPFQFTVGPLQDSGSHRVHAGGPGLARGVEGEPAEFNVWTREAGPGSLAISVEGPSKAQIDFKDRKDGSCYVSYIVDEPGEYSVGIRFNEEHIPESPYKVFIVPKAGHAEKVKITNLEEEQVVLNAPQSFLLSKNGASGSLECKMVSPSGREDDCFISQVGPDEYSVRFVPKEEGHHFLHAKLNGVHVPGSPFKIRVGSEGKKDGSVKVSGQGLDRVKTGERASFIIDTSNVGAGTLSVTVDGPSKVDMDCNEVEKGYEVSYTPLVPGDYFVTVKYNGLNVEGSPFKVVIVGGGATGAKSHLMSRRQSSSMTMETIQHTMIRQESSMFKESSNSSRSSSRQTGQQPIFVSDATQVACQGEGIEKPSLRKQNSFTVDAGRAGNNVLFVGVFGPETPCDEVVVKHQGEGQYGVSYRLTDPGQYILYIKWGEQHVPGSPFHIEV